MMNITLRIASLHIGIAGFVIAFMSFLDGFPIREVWSGIFLGLVFLLYGIDGNPLIERLLPSLVHEIRNENRVETVHENKP